MPNWVVNKLKRFAFTAGLLLCLVVSAGRFASPAFAQQLVGKPTPARLAQLGIRTYNGRHVTIHSDADPEVVQPLAAIFDRAVPLWARYLRLEVGDWHITANILAKPASQPAFASVGLWRDGLPEFKHGFAHPDMVWLYEQPSDYYRRHLLLHEGVHAFMLSKLGNAGPPWYCEGMAELLATHKLTDTELKLPYFPQSKEETPLWGRIKIVQDGCAAGRGLPVDAVLKFGSRDHLNSNEPYGWCWALSAFLAANPRWQKTFEGLGPTVSEPDFNARLRKAAGAGWPELCEGWQVFASELIYGYDVPRAAVQFAPGKPLTGATAVKVAADRGWQSSGIAVKAGVAYQITASGQFQVAETKRPWMSEANGVSIRYWNGRPLGMLMAAVRPDPVGGEPPAASGLLRSEPIGLSATLTPTTSGTLYFRVNDSPAELADNAGSVNVTVQAK